jgi:acyl-CoA synthetase (NDP forming)
VVEQAASPPAPTFSPAQAAARRDLRPLFDPRSVALVGGSDDPSKWGHSVARTLLAGERRRAVHFVSRSKETILGRPAYRSLAELSEPPELVVLVVPASVLEEWVEAALEVGARALVAISAGLGERDAEGRAMEERLAARVRAAGAILVGPNSMGVADYSTALGAAPWLDVPPGSIAFVSQSGNLSFELGTRARQVGLGFSRFVSLGNQADLEAAEAVASCAGHEATELIAVYCEDFRDGRAFVEAALEARRAGKPVLLLAPLRTEAGARAARSHTGALVSSSAAVDAACRAAAIHRVHTPRELVDLALALRAGIRPPGRRVAVVTTGGGNGVLAADALEASGLAVPSLPSSLAAQVEQALPEVGSARNPVDLIGTTLNDARLLARVAEILTASPEIDAVLLTGSPLVMWHGIAEDLARLEEETVPLLAAVARSSGKPILVNPDRELTPAARAALAAGIPVYRDVEAAAAVLARLAEPLEPEGLPLLPPRATSVLAEAGYWAARELLAQAGVPVVEARLVRTAAQARAAAAELGYPVVLKALGRLHKSDAGGVVLGIGSEAELERSFSDLETRLSPRAYSVERMAPVAEGVELLVGCRRDPRFGPVALAGLGGLFAEVLGDVALALAPVDEAQAERLLRRLRGAPLLLGVRGRPPVDLPAAARALAAVSRLAAAHPEVEEIEANPLLVTPEGALALDARVVLAGGKAR